MNVVLDTNIVVKGFINGDLSCLALLSSFYLNSDLKIVMDFPDYSNGNNKGVVRKEYFDNLKNVEFFQKWYTMLTNGQIDYFSGKLDRRIERELIKREFHEPTDRTFVALALESDKNLVTEESDYGIGGCDKAKHPKKQEVLRYLTELGLSVMNSHDAAHKFKSA